jgi:hypothetical protein
MKRISAWIVLLSATAFIAAGCGGGHRDEPQDGVKPEESQQMSDASDIARRLHGDFKLATPEEKAKFIALFGSKTAAKRMMKMMANPPVRKLKN